MGEETYSLLRSLIAPVKPTRKSYTDLARVLENHLKPKALIIAERLKFYERSQGNEESISDFIAAIRKLSLKCEFGEFLSEALRDRLVCGIQDVRIRKRLPVEKDSTWDKALEISKSLEGIEIEAKEMGGASSSVKEEESYEMKRSVAVEENVIDVAMSRI